MHSCRMRTACFSGRLSCTHPITHAPPCHTSPATHAPCHAHPHHACLPLPCMPPFTMHAPFTVHAPLYHACSLCHTHFPLCHTRSPFTMHAPLWTEFLTHACENIIFLQLLLRVVKITTIYFYTKWQCCHQSAFFPAKKVHTVRFALMILPMLYRLGCFIV